jgi:hypothetical protein
MERVWKSFLLPGQFASLPRMRTSLEEGRARFFHEDHRFLKSTSSVGGFKLETPVNAFEEKALKSKRAFGAGIVHHE